MDEMAEELGTRDVLEQVDALLRNVEQDIRALDTKVDVRFDRVQQEFSSVRSEIAGQTRWVVGLVFASWLTLMASIWLKT
jgi:hypothetical protein